MHGPETVLSHIVFLSWCDFVVPLVPLLPVQIARIYAQTDRYEEAETAFAEVCLASTGKEAILCDFAPLTLAALILELMC